MFKALLAFPKPLRNAKKNIDILSNENREGEQSDERTAFHLYGQFFESLERNGKKAFESSLKNFGKYANQG